jgi:phosphoribosylformimino-5-aminoimidazole carboxamide ribotide isomerase
MKILPVLDLMDGVVVHGIAGNRASYCPIKSLLTTETSPAGVAAALSAEFGFQEFYLADLDGLQSRRIDVRAYANLKEAGFRIIVDAGVRTVDEANNLIESGVDAVILALETNPSSELLDEFLNRFGPEKVIFSLDLKQGQPMGKIDGLSAVDARSLAVSLINRGYKRLIVLDLEAVGSETGPVTTELCTGIREVSKDTQIITGGGIRNLRDLQTLEQAGVDGVLMATALHNGTLDLKEITNYSR